MAATAIPSARNANLASRATDAATSPATSGITTGTGVTVAYPAPTPTTPATTPGPLTGERRTCLSLVARRNNGPPTCTWLVLSQSALSPCIHRRF